MLSRHLRRVATTLGALRRPVRAGAALRRGEATRLRAAPRRRVATTVGIALLVAACGGSAATPTIPPVDTVATPTPAPSVTAAATAFMARQATFRGGIIPYSGSLITGGTQFRLDGRYEIAGDDWYGIRTVYDDSASPDPTSAASEKIHLGGKAWTRITGGPWIESLAEAARTDSVPRFLAALPPVADAGVEDHAGRQLHRLVLADGATVPPGVFGLDATGYTVEPISMSTWVADDGTPVDTEFHMTWTGGGVHGETKSEQTLDFDLSKLGTPVTVAAPAKPWSAIVSDRFGYTLSVPNGYVRTEAPGEDRLGAAGTTTLSVRPEPVAASVDLDAAVAAATTEIAKETGATAEAPGETGLGGVRARILPWHYGPASARAYRLDAIAVRDGTTWRVTYIVPAGTAAEDASQRRTFEQILATVTFTK